MEKISEKEAFEKIIIFCNYRERSSKEVLIKLSSFGYDSNSSKKIINKLKKGFYTKGIKYKPIIAKLESSSDTYCWLQMSLREGKNREIRNIFE